MKKKIIIVNKNRNKYTDIPVTKHEENFKGRIIEESVLDKSIIKKK